MKSQRTTFRWLLLVGIAVVSTGQAVAQDAPKKTSSYAPVNQTEAFGSVMARMKAAKLAVMKKHADLLKTRYDLSDQPAKGVAMSRGKPVQEGVRAKLPEASRVMSGTTASPGTRVTPGTTATCGNRATPGTRASSPPWRRTPASTTGSARSKAAEPETRKCDAGHKGFWRL